MLNTASAADAKNIDRDRDFCISCWNGNLDRVTALLQQNPPLEMRMEDGRTPLILAAHGNPALVKLLLVHGAKVNVVDKKGDTPFSLAAENGILDSVQMLATAGADLNHANKWGRTPLMLAAREGHEDVVSFLVAQHALLNLTDSYGGSALSYALWKDHFAAAQVLLDAGCPATSVVAPGTAPNDWISPMNLAVRTFDQSLIDLLLAHGGKINEPDGFGHTALMELIYAHGHEDLINYLLEKGANPNVADARGFTPFLAVIRNEDAAMTRLFLQHGAKLEQTDSMGRTPLIFAACMQRANQITELIADKADVNARDKQGETALTRAGDLGRFDLVRLLQKAGATDTSLHIIPKDESRPPYSVPQRWALAVSAIYTQYNGESHQDIYTNSDNKISWRKSLHDEWSIDNHDELMAALDRLKRSLNWEGIVNQQMTDVMGADTQGGSRAALHHAAALLYLDLKWRGKLRVAWNACRAANLLREGVNVGYLTPEEAWPMLMANARRVQDTYGSWREMSDSFLDSREIWAGERDPVYRACATLLLNPKDSNSPWNQLPWKTDIAAQ